MNHPVRWLPLLALLCLSPQPVVGQVAAGCWAGVLGNGPQQVRGALELDSSSGEWAGRIHRLGASIDSDSLESVVVETGSVSFGFPSSLGPGVASFRGTVDGDSLTGTIASQGNQIPVAMMRTDPAAPDPALELLGYWSGGIRQGDVVVLRLGVELAPAPCGQVLATFDSPDQGAQDIPITSLRVSGDSLSFAVASAGGTFAGELDRAEGRTRGTWLQNLQSVPMELGRTDSVPSFSRPQDPEPPFPYADVEVSYASQTDGTTLAGTLLIPEGDGPFPAALLITGSGAQDRDETLMGHRPFLVIADHLARRGIAVLRVDDRGVGGSGGNVMESDIPDNVGDALAGVEYLRAHDAVDPERVGLVGHSEGGWVAPAAVARSDDIAFVVMLAGPAVPPEELLLAQARAIMEASGETELVEEQLAFAREAYSIIRSEPDDARAADRITRARETWMESLPPEAADAIRTELESPAMQATMAQQARSQTSTWFRGLLAFDPESYLEALDVPVLALFGELDLQVPAEQSAPVLRAMWADHPDATIHTFPELNHLFQHAETGLLTEYAQIEETFAPEALEMIGSWIEERFGP